MFEDQQLLNQYVHEGSGASLDTLIRRHLDLIYSSALRQTRGDSHLADDVTQAVFIVLARKAHTIHKGASIGAWLLSVTRRAALNAMRNRAIQLRHEMAAAKPEAGMESSNDWAQLEPLLDAALDRLGRKYRDAVVMRFFQEQSFEQIGVELGVNQATARKRVSRGIEQLRRMLAGRGASLGPESLGSLIAGCAVRTAPSHLTINLAASTGAASVAKSVMTMMIWTKAKIAAAIAASVTMAGAGVVIVATTLGQVQPPVQSIAPATSPAPPPATTAAVNFDSAAARKAITARFNSLQNLSVTYHVEHNPVSRRLSIFAAQLPPEPDADEPADITFSRLGADVRMETTHKVAVSLNDPNFASETRIWTIRGNIAEMLADKVRDGKRLDEFGVVADASKSTSNHDQLLAALGVAPMHFFQEQRESQLLTAAELEQMDISATPQGHVIMSRSLPLGSGYDEQWEFDPETGYAVSAYRLIAHDRSRVDIQVLASDFRPVNGLMLPFAVQEPRGDVTTRITTKEYKLDDTENTEARYHLTWPEGVKVSVNENRANFIAGKDGELISTDEQQRIKFKELVRPASTQPMVSGTTFDQPLVGIVVNNAEARRGPAAIDLETGDLGNVAGKLDERLDLGLDILFAKPFRASQASYAEWLLRGYHTFLFKLPAEAWDKPDPAVIKAAIAAGEPGVVVETGRPDYIWYRLGKGPEFPMVFAYRTRQGGIGMFRMTGIIADDGPKAVFDVYRIAAEPPR